MKKVSVIIPIYNAEKYLKKAIDSVLSQSYTEFELILVNDGSTDKSEEICLQYKKRDSRVLYIYKNNGGVCSARNLGIQQSTGDYLFFMDNDDDIHKDLLKDNILLLEEYDADMVKFEKRHREFLDDALQLEFNSTGISSLGIDENDICVYAGNQLKQMLYKIYKANLLINVWTGLYKASLFKENSLSFCEEFKNGHEDILMNMQCYEHSEKIVLNNKVYYTHNWRINGSASAVFKRERIDDAIKVVNYEKELFQKYEYSDEKILSIYMDNLFICLAIMNMKDGKCDKKTRKEMLEKYRSNMNNEIQNVNDCIIKLAKYDITRAVLAKTLQLKCYQVVNALFVVYMRLKKGNK